MNKISACFGGALALLVVLATSGEATEVTTKAVKLNLSGRVHTQFNTSSVDGELGSDFLIRRARLSFDIQMNDFVFGKVQPDFGKGKITLKDAYMKLVYGPNVSFRLGQFKRPFDIFELTSSTKILVVERALKVRGVGGKRSLSSLTEKLGFSDRDIGLEVKLQNDAKSVSLTAAVTNGTGANVIPSVARKDGDDVVGEKQYTGRATLRPMADTDFVIAVAGGMKPDALPLAAAKVVGDDLNPEVEYAVAVQADLEYGNFKSGPHVQAGVLWGENWDSAVHGADLPTFVAAQVIGTYKIPVDGNSYVEAVEPILRVSYADPNDEIEDDGGFLVTPGVQFFFVGRNKVAFNVDVFIPEADSEETEYSIKVQSSVHF